MAQLTAANVTYSLVEGSQVGSPSDPRFSALFDVTFGDGTATYTDGGIPLTKGKLGCPETLQELYLLDMNNESGYLYKYNRTSTSIQIFEAPLHIHEFLMAGGVTTTGDFLYHSSGAIGKAAATNVTISGSDPTNEGGVGPTSVAALSEVLTSAVVANSTVRLRAVGW